MCKRNRDGERVCVCERERERELRPRLPRRALSSTHPFIRVLLLAFLWKKWYSGSLDARSGRAPVIRGSATLITSSWRVRRMRPAL